MPRVSEMSAERKMQEREANWTTAIGWAGAGMEWQFVGYATDDNPVFALVSREGAVLGGAPTPGVDVEGILCREWSDEDWAEFSISNEPGYRESLYPYRY